MAKLLWIAFDPSEVMPGAAFAKAIGLPFDLLLISGSPTDTFGATRTMTAGLDPIPPADGLASALKPYCEGATHIGSVASMQSKDVLARLAGLLDAAVVTDVLSAESPNRFKRPMVAGSVIATVETLAEPVVVTVRPAGFGKVEPSGTVASETISLTTNSLATRISTSARGSSRPDLTQAKVVVSGGRPLKDAETFEALIGALADALGGAAGATRAAVDSGIAANELQVGQTGKIVAPDLYIAAGISGSTQHMAGIKDSKIIVAINKDPDAPIFEVADYGLVADLFDVLPELKKRAESR